jgi:hypothetical protein
MVLAKPARASDQVAALIGVQPVADPGQPIRLALRKDEAVRQAAAEPVMAPAPVEQPVEMAVAEPIAVAPQPAPVDVAPQPEPVAASTVTVDLPPPPPFSVEPEPAKLAEARPALSPAAVSLSDSLPKLRKAAATRPAAEGTSRAVVQLGAYSSRDRIAAAWSKVSGKYGSLKSYTPVTARFAGARGTVYRLAVKGFASEREAISLCNALKRAGRDCFVRTVSGDSPVQFASRS